MTPQELNIFIDCCKRVGKDPHELQDENPFTKKGGVAQIGCIPFCLFIMSTWESNLKMITIDDAPKLEALHTINWLKTRSELLLSKELAEEALSLINEFDDPLEAVS